MDGEIVADPVVVPSPKELLTNSALDLELLDNIKCEQSNSYTLSDSTFKAFAIQVENFGQANVAYKKVKLENIFTSHIMMACAIKDGPDIAVFSCDDGEDLAGAELEKLIREHSFYNYALFVARWKLGGNMGSRRFKCIQSVESQVIKKVKTKAELHPQHCPSDKVNNKAVKNRPGGPSSATQDHDYDQNSRPEEKKDEEQDDQIEKYGENADLDPSQDLLDGAPPVGQETLVSS